MPGPAVEGKRLPAGKLRAAYMRPLQSCPAGLRADMESAPTFVGVGVPDDPLLLLIINPPNNFRKGA